MKVDTQNLTPMVLRGAALAYAIEHPWGSPDAEFKAWLGRGQGVAQDTGRMHIAEQLAEWTRRVMDGESRTHIADLTESDRDAIIVAHRALSAVAAFDDLAVEAAT